MKLNTGAAAAALLSSAFFGAGAEAAAKPQPTSSGISTSSLNGGTTTPSVEKTEVEVLLQRHTGSPSEGFTLKSVNPEILESQLTIANTLVMNPGCIAFVEGIAEIKPDGGDEETIYTDISKRLIPFIFPDGLPKTTAELYELPHSPKLDEAILAGEFTKDEVITQRVAFVYFGGAKLASLFADVHLRGTASVEQQVENLLALALYQTKYGSFERAMEKSADARYLVTDKREQEAADAIALYTNAHPETRSAKLFLIFGHSHESTFGDERGNVKFT